MEQVYPAKRKKKKPKHLTLNGTNYTEGSKCPACSGERDTGGRLEFRLRTNWYLKCIKCKYSVQSDQAKLKQELYRKKKRDKSLKIVQSSHRKKKKLKITKADAKRAKLFLAEKKAKEKLEKLDDLSWI